MPKTPWEAGECLALTNLQRFIYIILPQALRIAVITTKLKKWRADKVYEHYFNQSLPEGMLNQ